MRKEQIEQFMRFSECNTIDEACEKLGMSAQAIDREITSLEDELGHTLLDRKVSKLELTCYGQVLAEECPHLLLEMHHLEEGFASQAKRRENSIKFSFFASAHSFMLTEQIANAFPERLFTVSIQGSASIISDIERGHVHIGVVPRAQVPNWLESIELIEEHAFLSVPSSSALYLKDFLSLEDVASEPVLFASDMYGFSQWYMDIYRAGGADMEHACTTDFENYLEQMNTTTCNRFGSSSLQAIGLTGSGRANIPIDDDRAKRTICLVYQKKDTERLARVLDYVRERKNILYTPHALYPYLLHPAHLDNLSYIDVRK